jgi:hypothetical protein
MFQTDGTRIWQLPLLLLLLLLPAFKARKR